MKVQIELPNEEEDQRDAWPDFLRHSQRKPQQFPIFKDFEQLSICIAFYSLQLLQNCFVLIKIWSVKQADNSSISKDPLSSEPSNIIHGNPIRSAANMIIILIVLATLIFMAILFKKKKIKSIFYKIHSYVDIFTICSLGAYILSEPSMNQNIFFESQSTCTCSSDANSDNIGMQELHYMLLLCQMIFNNKQKYIIRSKYNLRQELLNGILTTIIKLSFHIAIVVILLPNASMSRYVPIVINCVQFTIPDIISIYNHYKDFLQYQQNVSLSLSNSQQSAEQIKLCFCEEEQLQACHRRIQALNNMSQNYLIHNSLSNISNFNQTISEGNGFQGDLSSSQKPMLNNHHASLFRQNLSGKKKYLFKPHKLRGSQGNYYLDQESDEKWKSYLNQIPSGILLISKSLDQIQFANQFILQFFLNNFRKSQQRDILETVLREIKFKIISQFVSTNDKKRISRFSSSAKKQVRDSISNAEKKPVKRSLSNHNTTSNNNNAESKGSSPHPSQFHQSAKSNYEEGIFHPLAFQQTSNKILPQENETMTLEQILITFDQSTSVSNEIENSTLEIYAKSINVDNGENISIKGKVLYRAESDEYLLILEDITKYEYVTNLADRDNYKNRLISQFSHELRTPLNSSMGFLQSALLDQSISQNIKDLYLIPAFQSLRLQFYFINDILDFSQILAKRDLQLNFIKFNINQMLTDIYNLYHNSFESKGIDLFFQVDSKILNQEICTDYDRLMQVIVNLINNSLRFTLKGSVTIKINPTNLNNLSLQVEDTGEGMNMQQFEQIKQMLSTFDQIGIPISETQHAGKQFQSITLTQQLYYFKDLDCRYLRSQSAFQQQKIKMNWNSRKRMEEAALSAFALKIYQICKAAIAKLLTTLQKQIKLKELQRELIAQALRMQFAENLMKEQGRTIGTHFSGHNLHRRGLKRNNTTSISRLDDFKVPSLKLFQTPSSFFKKNIFDTKNTPESLSSNEKTPDSKRKPEEGDTQRSDNFKKKSFFLKPKYKTQDIVDEVQNHPFSAQKPTQQINLSTVPPENPLGISNATCNQSYHHQKKSFVIQQSQVLSSHHILNVQHQPKQKLNIDEHSTLALRSEITIENENTNAQNQLYSYNFNQILTHTRSNLFQFSPQVHSARVRTPSTFQIQNLSQKSLDSKLSIENKSPLFLSPHQHKNLKSPTRSHCESIKKSQLGKQQNQVKFYLQSELIGVLGNMHEQCPKPANGDTVLAHSKIPRRSSIEDSLQVFEDKCEKYDQIQFTKKDEILSLHNEHAEGEGGDNHLKEHPKLLGKQKGIGKPRKFSLVKYNTLQINQSHKQNELQGGNNNLKPTEFFNQLQLSEQCSEFSWQNTDINPDVLKTQQEIAQRNDFAIENQSTSSFPIINLYNIKRCTSKPQPRQPQNDILKPALNILNKQQAGSVHTALPGDTEGAVLEQKDQSATSSTNKKFNRNLSWLRQSSLQERVDKSMSNNDDTNNNITNQNFPQLKSEMIIPSSIPFQDMLSRCTCKRILCVDDEIFNLQVLLLLFKKLGYLILKAFNGKEAIQLFNSMYTEKKAEYQCESSNCTVFKAIILDCNMPIMNGWQCAKELRNLMTQKKLPSIPIIALTAYIAQQAYNQCKESGMDEVINKPISFEKLRDTVATYIQIYENDSANLQWI